MSFLAPWYLLLVAAAAVPLLIHLLRRRIGVEVDFPAARYLARAEREHSRTLRMRNLLLMLLRVLAVMLIAVAASRPTARLAGAGHAPTALAIVLDNSMSTSLVEQGTPLFDRLKRMTRDVLAAATPDDRVFIITADGVIRGGTAGSLREEIDRLHPYAGAGKLRDAVARGAAAVEATGFDARQVAVLTDGQRSSWSEPASVHAEIPMLVWAPGVDAPMNRAVVVAEPRPIRWTPRGAIATRLIAADSTTYRIALGGRTLARGTVIPGEEAVLRAAPPERGWTAGAVEIEPDELTADNIRHFALWVGPPPAVSVTSGAGPFAKNAVDVLRASERVAEGTGIQVASADEASTIPALLLPPSDPVRLGAANRSLERLGIPWRFGALRREAATAKGEALAAGVVTVSSRYQLIPRAAPDAETLAVVGRDPWIVAGPKYVIVGSPLNPAATSLPVSAAFLPWLGDVLASRLHSEPGTVRFTSPGGRVPRPAGVEALERADGGRIDLTSGGTSIDAPAAVGTYFLIQGSRRVGAIVVNPETSESQLERWSSDELARHVATIPVRVAKDGADWTRLAFTGAARRSLSVPLLLSLIVVLGLETVAAVGGRQQR